MHLKKEKGNNVDVHMHCKNIYLTIQPEDMEGLTGLLTHVRHREKQEANSRLEARVNQFKLFAEKQRAVSTHMKEEKTC